MIRPKALMIVGASVSLVSLVVPRLPLLPTGIGSGRMSLAATAAFCASPLGKLGDALSTSFAGLCGHIALLSAIGWALLVSGLGVVVIGARMRWRGWPK